MWKIIHLVNDVGIQTHNLWIISLHPLTTCCCVYAIAKNIVSSRWVISKLVWLLVRYEPSSSSSKELLGDELFKLEKERGRCRSYARETCKILEQDHGHKIMKNWQTFITNILSFSGSPSLSILLSLSLNICPENTKRYGKYHCTAGLQFNKSALD